MSHVNAHDMPVAPDSRFPRATLALENPQKF
jgi:hypothetical protein